MRENIRPDSRDAGRKTSKVHKGKRMEPRPICPKWGRKKVVLVVCEYRTREVKDE